MSNLMAADLRVTWSGTAEANDSRIGMVEILNQHGQELSGTVATSDDTKPEPIEKAGIRGDVGTFEMRDDAKRVVRFRLELKSGLMIGETSVGDHVSKVELPPAADAGLNPIAGGR